jgi:hypothetical protein
MDGRREIEPKTLRDIFFYLPVANLVILIKGGILKIWRETLLLLLLGIDKPPAIN